ncbi:dolichol phosphate-mannose biosynthesis regulatory protein isoform 2-T2 [Syngnathus typhle]
MQAMSLYVLHIDQEGTAAISNHVSAAGFTKKKTTRKRPHILPVRKMKIMVQQFLKKSLSRMECGKEQGDQVQLGPGFIGGTQNTDLATGVDQAAGMSLIVFSLMLFTYYSIWVIVLPFMDTDHVLHKYFLPREYSVILPGIAAVLLLLCIGAFTAIVLWKNQKPKKVN